MKKPDIQKAYEILAETYPNTETELTYKDCYQLLVAVVLSAQCTDARVNQTTPALFARYPDPQSMVKAKLSDIEKLIHSCGFFRAKAKAIQSLSQDLIDRFGGKVPRTLEELITLRGVGRKTASVILNQAFDIPAIAVDTHVARVSARLGWAKSKTPDKIEFELRDLFPPENWGAINGMLILHGRRLCKARKPLCADCPVQKHCQYFQKSH
ncbi:MAG: endonuclease III [Deltaproteobacteria bacterium]|nr:endonuclease III [Deltaproteobacteria bacterium]